MEKEAWIVGHVDDYERIYHGGTLAGAVTIYRRYEHKDPKKTFAFFLASNSDSIPKAENIANDIANALAGKEIEKVKAWKGDRMTHNRKSDAQVFSGTYRCEELGTKWIVRPKEKAPGKWAVQMIPADGGAFPRFDFDPIRNKDGLVIFQSGYGKGTLEKTEDGFIYNAENMAPVHFTRGPFMKYKSS